MAQFRIISQVIIAVAVSIFLSASAQAGAKMDPIKALAEVNAGTMVLLDIRRPSEWKQSGVPEVAIPLSMHRENFLPGLQAVLKENPGKKIGVICATGARTNWLQTELSKRGIVDVVDVSEGMFGNGKGPGWLARGLPIKKVK